MTAVLRVHRGTAASDLIVEVGRIPLGNLVDAVTEFVIPSGTTIVELKNGWYHSVATRINVPDGGAIELYAVDNPDAVLPMLQGGYHKVVSAQD